MRKIAALSLVLIIIVCCLSGCGDYSYFRYGASAKYLNMFDETGRAMPDSAPIYDSYYIKNRATFVEDMDIVIVPEEGKSVGDLELADGKDYIEATWDDVKGFTFEEVPSMMGLGKDKYKGFEVIFAKAKDTEDDVTWEEAMANDGVMWTSITDNENVAGQTIFGEHKPKDVVKTVKEVLGNPTNLAWSASAETTNVVLQYDLDFAKVQVMVIKDSEGNGWFTSVDFIPQ